MSECVAYQLKKFKFLSKGCNELNTQQILRATSKSGNCQIIVWT